MQYVVGFARQLHFVLLIRKKRPAWQAGLLNGVGGKVEDGETLREAMIREFNEEAGLFIVEWRRRVELRCAAGTVHFFAADVDLSRVRQQTDEELVVMPLASLWSTVGIVPNLRWLVPLCLDNDVDIATVEEEVP